MRIKVRHIHLPLAALTLALFLALGAGGSAAQNIVALVNDEAITSYDVTQRMRWTARTSKFGDAMRAALTSEATKKKFQQMMMAANPKSQAEAEKAAEIIKKRIIDEAKQRVLNDGAGTSRKAALEAIIEDRLKLQAAKKLNITISDTEVEETLAQRTGGGQGKVDLSEFYRQFEADGISKKTIQDIIRAQLAWRDVIRREYGPRLQSLIAAIPEADAKPDNSSILYNVRVLRVSIAPGAGEVDKSRRMLDAENLKQKFTSCENLPKAAKLIANAAVKTMNRAKLSDFPKEAQPLISSANEGQMTPPILLGDAIESYAVCKKLSTAKGSPASSKPDQRQLEYERFSKRHLQLVKAGASIDYRGNN